MNGAWQTPQLVGVTTIWRHMVDIQMSTSGEKCMEQSFAAVLHKKKNIFKTYNMSPKTAHRLHSWLYKHKKKECNHAHDIQPDSSPVDAWKDTRIHSTDAHSQTQEQICVNT